MQCQTTNKGKECKNKATHYIGSSGKGKKLLACDSCTRAWIKQDRVVTPLPVTKKQV